MRRDNRFGIVHILNFGNNFMMLVTHSHTKPTPRIRVYDVPFQIATRRGERFGPVSMLWRLLEQRFQ